MRKLSAPQMRALRQLLREETYPYINFRTGESLRALGLIERDTSFVVKRVYADERGEHLQFEQAEPVRWHDWYITLKGRALLHGEAQP